MTALASRALRRLSLLAATAALGGCTLIPPTFTELPSEGGMGLPTKLEGETYDGERIPFAAELSVGDDGCAYLDFGKGALVAIWPQGSELSAPVRLADGAELEPGDIVEGLGTIVHFGALPGGPNSYWSFVTGFCAGDAPRALVVDEVSEVR